MSIVGRLQDYSEFAERVEVLCREFRANEGGAEGQEKREELKMRLAELCGEGLEVVRETGEVGLLLALMDAYEITRDEGMLQEVLDVVSGNLEKLEVSVESVRLLCYCYYYTEDEECGELARGMLEKLRGDEEEYAEVLEVFREMVGEF